MQLQMWNGTIWTASWCSGNADGAWREQAGETFWLKQAAGLRISVCRGIKEKGIYDEI